LSSSSSSLFCAFLPVDPADPSYEELELDLDDLKLTVEECEDGLDKVLASQDALKKVPRQRFLTTPFFCYFFCYVGFIIIIIILIIIIIIFVIVVICLVVFGFCWLCLGLVGL
jgi:hypothetical protein